jgi:hypothetical protein
MYVHLSFCFFLIGLWPGLVNIHPGAESTLKDLALLVIGFYLGFVGSYFSQ